MKLNCAPHLRTVGAADLNVSLYSPRRSVPRCATIGAALVREEHWPGRLPSITAVDFATLALAVLAGDTFVRRSETDDGWMRDIELEVALVSPATWEPVRSDLERVLGFLTGDRWRLRLGSGPSPAYAVDSRRSAPSASAVALFSGGLDSTAALLHRATAGGHPAALVSYSYPRDGAIQERICAAVGFRGYRVPFNLDPVHVGLNETTMRGRSLGFLALACLVASTLPGWNPNGSVCLHVPENGLIAINPPLTPRRIGALSTRTTHPSFLNGVQRIFNVVGMGVQIVNPYASMTKGELLTLALQSGLTPAVAAQTVSCGKWKRRRVQCGRCVPCIIRRAAFHAAGIQDTTRYQHTTLARVLQDPLQRDDLLSMAMACSRVSAFNDREFRAWVSCAGRMPSLPQERSAILSVVRRGLEEVKEYLAHEGCI